MSSLFSSGSDDRAEALPAFDDVVAARGPKHAVLAGVAALAVLAGGGGGLFWLAGSPVADASSVSVPAGGAGAVDGSNPVPTSPTSPASFAFSGREIVAAPAAGGGGAEASPGVSGDASPAGTTVVVPGGTPSSSAPSPAARPTTAPGGGGSATAAPTPRPTTPGGRTTPTPVRSTAAPWQQGAVRFDGIDVPSPDGTGAFVLDTKGLNPVRVRLAAGALIPSTSTVYRPVGEVKERPMTADETTACQDSVKAAATQEEAAAIGRKTENCTSVVDSVWVPLLVPSNQGAAGAQASAGWVLTPDADLPAAALGKVTGTVRFLGERTRSILVQVGNGVPVWVAEGGAVPGTPLTYTGQKLDAPKRTGVAVFTSANVTYFTALGGGEKSGITF